MCPKVPLAAETEAVASARMAGFSYIVSSLETGLQPDHHEMMFLIRSSLTRNGALNPQTMLAAVDGLRNQLQQHTFALKCEHDTQVAALSSQPLSLRRAIRHYKFFTHRTRYREVVMQLLHYHTEEIMLRSSRRIDSVVKAA